MVGDTWFSLLLLVKKFSRDDKSGPLKDSVISDSLQKSTNSFSVLQLCNKNHVNRLKFNRLFMFTNLEL